jgi:hypothetical protein
MVGLIIAVTFASLGLTQCSNYDPSNYIGNNTGTDWDGYKSGNLSVNDAGTITGNNNYTAENLVIPHQIRTADGKVIKLKEIGGSAFLNKTSLTGTIHFPNTLELIGGSAFLNCTGLRGDLIIPDSVLFIGGSAFANCSGFNQALKIYGDSIPTIGSSAFSGCSGFTKIVFIDWNVLPDWTTVQIFNGFKNDENNPGVFYTQNGLAPANTILNKLKTLYGLPENWYTTSN